MTQDTIWHLYRSGFVRRYAQNPEMAHLGETVGHHQWGVAVLMLRLFGARASRTLLVEALLHDAGEMGAADASRPAKRRHPEMASTIARAEGKEREALGVPRVHLRNDEARMLDLCDGLEAYLFTSVRAPHMLDSHGWPEMRQDLIAAARGLGVGAAVEALIAKG